MCYLNFATKAENRHERSRQWRVVTEAHFAELEDDQEASIRRCNLGELRLCSVSVGRHRLESGSPTPTAENEGLLKFIFQEEGACVIEQAGATATVTAGQWCAIDKTRPFVVHATGASRQIAMSLPRHKIVRGQGASRMLFKPEGFLRGAGQVLHSSASAAIFAGAMLGRSDRERLGEALTTLLNFAWHAEPPSERPETQRRRSEVLNYIEHHLGEPDLTVSGIAHALSYSKRALHQLFSDDVTTVGRLIWDRRLERCRSELADPTCVAVSITEIAHRWGFSDSQHFSRSFKTRFGTCPRAYRHSHVSS